MLYIVGGKNIVCSGIVYVVKKTGCFNFKTEENMRY